MALKVVETRIIGPGKGLVVLSSESTEELKDHRGRAEALKAGSTMGFNGLLPPRGGCYRRMKDGTPCESPEEMEKHRKELAMRGGQDLWYRDFEVGPSSSNIPVG